METKLVKDVMLSLRDYGMVADDATLLDAVIALDNAQPPAGSGRQPHRAVLVTDQNGKVIGKLGHLAFLKALEPKYHELGDIAILARAGISSTFVESMKENLQIWQDSLPDLCKRARKIKVRDVMHPVTESIDESASLTEAIHKLIMWQTLSLLVKREGEIVGILRLSDVYDEIATYMKAKESGRWPKPDHP